MTEKRIIALLLALALCLLAFPALSAEKAASPSITEVRWQETTTGISGTLKETGTADNGADRLLEVTISSEAAESLTLTFYDAKGKAVGDKQTLTPDSDGKASWSCQIASGSEPGTYKLKIVAKNGKKSTTKTLKFKLKEYSYTALPDAAMQAKFEELERLMPSGKFWNHGMPGEKTIRLGGPLDITTTICNETCPSRFQTDKHYMDSDSTCNYAFHGYQCHGWAMMIAAYLFEEDPGRFERLSQPATADALLPGDVVRYKNNQHTILVLRVEDGYVYFTDCNFDKTCEIRWNAKVAVSQLKKTFTYVIRRPAV